MANAGSLSASIVLGGMDAVERQLKNFSDAMRDASKNASDMGGKLKDAGGSISDFGQELAGISAGLVGFGVAGVMASEEISNGIATFQTKLGASGADLIKYEGVMNEVAKSGVGSFTEVADSVVLVAQNMKGLSDADLSTVTEEAMELANVMGSDTSEVAKTAGILMKQFGVEGLEAMDLIAKGYQNGMDFAGDYQDTLSEYSVYFSQMGFEADDMFNVLISGAEAGAFNLDKVGDAVKEFGIRSKDGSKASQEAFSALGMDADKMTQIFAKGGEGAKKGYAEVVTALSGVKSQTERNAIGVSLFGTQYEDMEADVIASTGAITEHMQGIEGASMEVAQNNKTLASAMKGAWNEISIAIKPVGDILKEVIIAVLPIVIGLITVLSSAFTALSPNMQKAVVAFGAIVAVIPILLMALGTMLSIFGTLVTGVGAVSKGFGLFSKAGTKLITGLKLVGKAFLWLGRLFMANPFMLIVAGIIIVAVLIYKYWDEIVAVTKAVWSALSAWFAPYWEAFKAMVGAVVDWMVEAWNGFKSGFVSIMQGLASFFSGIWEGMKKIFMAVFDFYVSYVTFVFGIIQTIVQTAWKVISTIFLIALGIIVTLLAPLWNAFATGWNKIVSLGTVAVNKIKAFISSMVTALMGYWNVFKTGVQAIWGYIVANVITPIVTKIKSIITTLIGKATEIMNTIKAVFTTAWNFIYSNVVSPVIAKVKSIVGTITAFVMSVLNRVLQGWLNIFNAVKSVVTTVINAIKNVIQTIVAKVTSVGNSVKSTLTGAFNSAKTAVFTAISNIVSKVESIWTKAKSVANNIKKAFSNLFGGIKMPSFSMGGWKPADLPSMPKMKVQWNANGGILDSATMIGAGEKGAESIVPLSSQRRMKPFAMAVSKFMPEGATAGGGVNVTVSQMVVREEADIRKVSQELYKLIERDRKGGGKR